MDLSGLEDGWRTVRGGLVSEKDGVLDKSWIAEDEESQRHESFDSGLLSLDLNSLSFVAPWASPSEEETTWPAEATQNQRYAGTVPFSLGQSRIADGGGRVGWKKGVESTNKRPQLLHPDTLEPMKVEGGQWVAEKLFKNIKTEG